MSELLYRFIECIDGEHSFKIMLYRMAEKIKLFLLRRLE